MRVVITGASGFVGCHAVAALQAAGHEPVLLIRDPEKTARVLASVGVTETPETHKADIRDARAVRACLERGEAVLHAAAEIGITGRGGDLAGTNVTGLRNVLGQAAELGLDPIVHVSTTTVFIPPRGPVITADGPLSSPRTEYGRTKVDGERYARALQDDGHPVTIVYPPGVIGPHQPKLDSMVEGLRGGLVQGWPITTGGAGLMDVRDLAVALTRCLEPGKGARRFLLGGHFLRWAELADVCDEVTGRRCRRYPAPAALLRAAAAVLDTVKKVRPVDYPLTRDAVDIMVTTVPADDAETMDALALRLRPVQESVADTLRWLAEAGHIAPRYIGRLARTSQSEEDIAL
ncbi:NAD-dependent epimerase/dehydratase family protein [Sphaerisporangium corydalis]|uniref:NAD-dependent epimerase/dehydratase family protein n=1 Tax=Sphaerisporangium corydalis TaxID=1441875 RepID=A0ABV9EUL3_9ACTN|nr:NAD-dependent epimerase/dehydratase family protein [Sphaerisporangium corydalis]